MQSNNEIDAKIAALTAETARIQAEIEKLKSEGDKARANVRVLRSDSDAESIWLYTKDGDPSLVTIWREDCHDAGIDPEYLARCIEVVLPMSDFIRRWYVGKGCDTGLLGNWLAGELGHKSKNGNNTGQTEAARAAGYID